MDFTFSRSSISFLKDAPSNIDVNMTSGWRHHYFDGLSADEMSSFIRLIKDDNIYLLIPLFSSSKSLSKATLNLSEPFLVDNNSNPVLIAKFIIDQWNSSGFIKKEDIAFTFSFKFKRVWFSDK